MHTQGGRLGSTPATSPSPQGAFTAASRPSHQVFFRLNELDDLMAGVASSLTQHAEVRSQAFHLQLQVIGGMGCMITFAR